MNSTEKCHAPLCQFIKNMDHFKNKYNFSHNRQKYKLEVIIDEILYVLKAGNSWTSHRGPIPGKTLNAHFVEFNKNRVFELFYSSLLSSYFDKYSHRLDHILTDASVFTNKFGKSAKSLDFLARCKLWKGRNAAKLTVVTDSYGIPISALCGKGTAHDSQLLFRNLENMIIDFETINKITDDNKLLNIKKIVTVNNEENNTVTPKYILADSAYDSKDIRKFFIDKSYIPVIDFNKKNTKDPEKLKLKTLTSSEKTIYKKRIEVEHLFSKIKQNRRLSHVYESDKKNFTGFVFLALIKIIFFQLCPNKNIVKKK